MSASASPSIVDAPDQEDGARLYVGHVMHLRLRPKRHQFRYSVFSLWLDVDRLDQTASRLKRFAVDRFALFAFYRRDHGRRDGSDLRPWVEEQLAAAGLVRDARDRPGRIMLLSFPRVLGYAFNPLSVYYCYDAHDRLRHIVYEVKNTFGDQHPYAVAANADDDGLSRHDRLKEFFVSPFIDMEKTYRFTTASPSDRLSLRIKETDDVGDYLIATWNGDAEPLTDRALLRRFVSHPLMTLRVILGIHWEALRLAIKGVRFLGHPGDENVVVKRERSAEAIADG